MIKHLSWDSEHFGIKVGRVEVPLLDIDIYQSVLKQAKSAEYDLVYVIGAYAVQGLLNSQFYLVDKKVVYELQVNSIDYTLEEVCEIPKNTDYRLLLDLAFESGKYSRYKNDQKMPPHVFNTLYSKWLQNAVEGIRNQKVLAISRNNKFVGMLTYQPEPDNHYSIGLIAVSPEYTGQGLGSMLLNKLFSIVGNGATIEVATQKINTIACHYYEKNGFAIKSITPIYHMWVR